MRRMYIPFSNNYWTSSTLKKLLDHSVMKTYIFLFLKLKCVGNLFLSMKSLDVVRFSCIYCHIIMHFVVDLLVAFIEIY